MEKIKVNMSPNPLDVQTIHASQNDGEARQWEFELHNNGELIDTSEITEQMFFKSYKGGTEQILPENTSTPTTSPFLGDIRYPQGLLTDQEFTYRQSPTEEDGLAKITDIKGNTLVWNQLIPIDWVSTRTFSDGLSVTNNNDGSYTLNGTATQSRFPTRNTEVYGIQGHKYLIQVLSSQNKAVISQNGSTVYVYSSAIYTAQNNNAFIIYFNANTYNNEKIIPMIIDLTKMFDSGNEPTTVEGFTSLFPLSYYSYNQGSLLSFNGNGIKTVGFNQWDEEWELGSIDSTGQNTPSTTEIRSKNYIPVILGESYYIKQTGVQVFHYYDGDLNYLGNQYIGETRLLNIPSGTEYIRFRCANTYGTSYKNDICLNISDPSRNGTYEPYKESSLSLTILTYFPTGMKSTGSYYDELTLTKAITRMGAITFDGTQTPVINTITSAQCRAFYNVSDVLPVTRDSQVIEQDLISNYLPCNSNYNTNLGAEGIHRRIGGHTQICVSLGLNRGITTWDEFKAYLSAHPLTVYYPLATPTETSFTTASLVTENEEIPLSNEDGVLVGKCTEELSAEPGFHDAKIKLADADGTCYSNKIQLHVERSPQ